MATGDIPAAAQIHALVAPTQKTRFVDDSGVLVQIGLQQLQQINRWLTGTNRIVPCSSSGTNTVTLTPIPAGPLVTGYFDYDVFSAVAANTSTGAVTALVALPTGNLSTLKVYVSNGGSQAGAGDLTQGRHYTFTYVDSLDSSAGGFVLR